MALSRVTRLSRASHASKMGELVLREHADEVFASDEAVYSAVGGAVAHDTEQASERAAASASRTRARGRVGKGGEGRLLTASCTASAVVSSSRNYDLRDQTMSHHIAPC
eukprot:2131778-Pleurochrysis_carterae.AAC.1